MERGVNLHKGDRTMKENQMIQYLEVCSDFVHKAAIRRANSLDDGDGVVIVPITVCMLVRTDEDGRGGTVVGSTVRVPVGAPPDKMAEVLQRSAEAMVQIPDTHDEDTHHFQVRPGGKVEPLEEDGPAEETIQ